MAERDPNALYDEEGEILAYNGCVACRPHDPCPEHGNSPMPWHYNNDDELPPDDDPY